MPRPPVDRGVASGGAPPADPTPQRSARSCPQGPTRRARGDHPLDLHRRARRASARAPARGGTQLKRRLPKIAALLEQAEADVLAFYAFAAEHWPKPRSTNPLERCDREIGRRTDVVGIFPDDASLIRPVSMLAIVATDEWLVGRSHISQKSLATLSDPRLQGDISLKIKTRRSSSSRLEPPTASPTSEASSYTTYWDLTPLPAHDAASQAEGGAQPSPRGRAA